MDPSIPRSNTMEPPEQTVDLEDPGAHDLDVSSDEQHFSDASDGEKGRSARPQSQSSCHNAPLPRTRVERVDEQPSHGEVPGLPAYDMRRQDAVPDELEIVTEGSQSKQNSAPNSRRSLSPAGTPVPLMVVEKLDPTASSHGDVPGTAAYAQRRADATPDLVFKTSDPSLPGSRSSSPSAKAHHTMSISQTTVTQPDTLQGPDKDPKASVGGKSSIEVVPSLEDSEQPGEGSLVLDGPDPNGTAKLKPSFDHTQDNEQGDGLGDDFDEFEEGAQAGEDDEFGDFDDGLKGSPTPKKLSVVSSSKVEAPTQPSVPLLDFDSFSSLPDLTSATQDHLDAIFPDTTRESLATLPTPEPVPAGSPIFSTERSRALWQQLITPPPLQPPNWTKSRIRRLFLVSLGVPVDLDEILPPSKQKKLVLPDMHLEAANQRSENGRTHGSVSVLKARATNDSSVSIDSARSSSKGRRRQKGPPPPPELDLGAVKRLCATTDEKLDGFMDLELKEHIQELNAKIGKTQELLEYWLQRRDGAMKEKEAFEGVIENLVRHARRVRN